MFVLTAKISKPRLIAIGVALVAAVLIIILLVGSGGNPSVEPSDTSRLAATNDDRIAFLAGFGWSVNGEPTETQKVRIPDETDNRVFSRYNDLQLSQGFDLTQYAGREVMRYVYEILNYPNASSPVYASLLVCNGQVIGGDITNTAPDGTMHGFAAGTGTEPTQTVPSSDVTEVTESTEPVETDETEAVTGE